MIEEQEVKEKEIINPEANEQTEVVEETKIEGEAPQAEEATNETPEEINWKKFRDERSRDRKEKDEQVRINKKLADEKAEQTRIYKETLEQVMNKSDNQNLSKNEQEKIIADLMDEDIPTGADIKGFINRVVPQIVNSVLDTRDQTSKQERTKKETQEIPQRLERDHEGFKDTVTEENLDYLEYHYPEVAETLGSLPNSYNKWSKIYKTVKRLVPQTNKNDVKRMERNSQKPQPMVNSPTHSSREQGHGRSMTESQKMENYKRLQELARGA